MRGAGPSLGSEQLASKSALAARHRRKIMMWARPSRFFQSRLCKSNGAFVYGSIPNVAEADFFREEAKQSTARSVKQVEARTSAEVVVAVRRRSGDYRVAAYHCGFFVGGLVVLYLLLAPQVFTVADIALDGALGFGAGLALALNVSAVLRLWVREKTLAKCVADAAHAAFFDLGISRTTARNGLLVFVSTFEQRALVVTDFGVDVAGLGPKWSEACAALSLAVKRRDVPGFETALVSLGPILGATMPRSADDVNELPDEVR
jgi:putative membrane protein